MFYNFIAFLLRGYFEFFFKLELNNLERLSQEGKLIICSNHISNYDPMLLIAISPRSISWMGKKELFQNRLVAYFLDKIGAFPVDRDRPGLDTVRKSMKVLKEGQILGIFPEGTRVKEYDLENAKPGVALISIQAKAPVIPIYIESTYKLFSKIKVNIGHKMEFSEFYKSKANKDDYKLLGEKVLREIYELKE